ncbi:MAG: Peptidase family [Bacteroidota bacterium]|jgi:hypothetical protein
MLHKFLRCIILFVVASATTNAQHVFTANTSGEYPIAQQLVPQLHPDHTARKTRAGAIFDTTQWAHLVDSVYGYGDADSIKLEAFDQFWNYISTKYPCFVNLPMYNWDSIALAMHNEIAAGVTAGRFAGIRSHLLHLLNDGHTYFYDGNFGNVPFFHGIPFVYDTDPGFGACITYTIDSHLVVYEASPGHVFNLQRGDEILGYNNIPWAQLVQTILRHQLPKAYGTAASPASQWHMYMTSVGANWHLFDSINIKKCNGTIESYPTDLMFGPSYFNFCTEQILPSTVLKLSPGQIFNQGREISSAVMPQSQIGYVAMYKCGDVSGDSLYNHVKRLVEVDQVKGLVLDVRFNAGGGFLAYQKTFNYLADTSCVWVGYSLRNSAANKYGLGIAGPPSTYYIGDALAASSKIPLAILTGPASVSAGDFIPLMFRNLSTARTFGLPTNSAYGHLEVIPMNHQNYWAATQGSNFFVHEKSWQHLTHLNYPVDSTVWFTSAGLCSGNDNVLNTAVDWINGLITWPAGLDATQNAIAQLWPNPAKDELQIDATTSGDLFIYNIQGQLLQTHSLTPGLHRIDITALPVGALLATFQSSNGSSTSRTFVHQY